MCPTNDNHTDLADKIRGVIYGQAIGDALGLGTEFLTKAEVRQYYPHGLTRFGQIIPDRHRRRWNRAAWTDDTDQMLCILDSLLEKNKVDIQDIAGRLFQWALHGMGIGQTVQQVVFGTDFLTDPHGMAKRVWEQSGKNSAANGGVMRTAILGIWDYDDPEQVRRNAEAVCKITHYDPRCVGSCVIVCLIISRLLQGETDIDALFALAYREANHYDPRIAEYLDKADHLTPELLDLTEGMNAATNDNGKIGYTLKTMGAGLWALKYAESFMGGILTIVNEGGDADTNAAVAGALLGAKYGYTNIPENYAKALFDHQSLDERIEDLLRVWT